MRIEDVEALLHGKREFVCVDLETTGISTPSSRIIEVAAARINSNGKLTREFTSLAHPGSGYVHGAEFVHGIKQHEVESAPPIATVLHQLLDFIGDRVVVAHNLPFENRFLTFELGRALIDPGELEGFCTYSAARRLVVTGTNHKLASLAQYFKIRQTTSHRALPDARIGALLAWELLTIVRSGEIAASGPPPRRRAAAPRSSAAPATAPLLPPAPGRLATVRAGFRPAWEPSPEQAAILDSFFGSGDIKILAGAGTGKTTTLQLLANSTKAKITYLTFNKATAVEAKGCFSSNVTATTIHAFAYRDLTSQGHGHWLGRLRLGIEPIAVTARRLGATEPGFAEAFGGPKVAKQVTPYDLTKMAVDTVANYCHSPSRKLLARHVSTGRASGSLRTSLTPLVLLMAEEHWANIRDETVTDMPITHDHYLKTWLLNGPSIGHSGDVLFVDEAQDLSPAVSHAIKAQKHLKKVFVGDPNQSIYGFAGGKDALASVTAAHTLPLSTSWRFGEDVAAIANGWLRSLSAPHPVRPNPSLATLIGPCEQPDAVLTRTNAAAVWELMALQDSGQWPRLRSDHQSILGLLRGATDLMEGRRAGHALLRHFISWTEVQEHVLYDSSAHELRTWTKLIELHGVTALERAVTDASAGLGTGAVISTAHKAKGLEWDTVRICSDFAEILARVALGGDKDQLAEEKRLAYVAVTRARTHLDPGPLASFADFLN
ncbi:exonuclease domain-containing protein [Pseudarthrobacter sp. S6]|uniref:exonuclease domain-containing protein n=1 Tax=Pseudarthrobacter sp. S6 TaxID=3418420 RepID=UPI003CF03AD8